MKATPTKAVAKKSTALPVTKLPKLTVPPNTGFGAMVAAKVVSAPPPPPAPTTPAVPKPVRLEQNGRKEYTPGTIGYRIWQTADALQASSPTGEVTSTVVRVALPDVSPASVSAGLSHWRKFRGILHIKGA